MSSSCDIFPISSKNESKDERKSCGVIELKMGWERYLLLEQQAWVEAEVYSLKKRKKNGQERAEDKRGDRGEGIGPEQGTKHGVIK